MKNRALLAIVCLVALGAVAMLLLMQKAVPPVTPDKTTKVRPASAPAALSVPPPAKSVSTITPAARSKEYVRPSNVSKPVATILGMDDKKKDYNSRTKAMRELTWDMPTNDVAALMQFLDAKSGEQKDMTPEQFNGVKNDILDLLLRQNHVPDSIATQLVSMYEDAGHDDVWRDYCVQYLADCYDRLSAKGRDPSGGRDGLPAAGEATNQVTAALGSITNAYWKALGEKDKTIAGTSLMALERLSRNHPEFERNQIAGKAFDLASDDVCGEAARITAFRICAMMEKKEILSVAKVVAQTGQTTSLRMAAVATVGDLGGKGDVELIRSLAAESDKRISNCASNALVRLNKRLAKEVSKNTN